MKKREMEVEVEIVSRPYSKKSKKEEALHEMHEGKETKSFKSVEHHLAMAKKHHMQAMHHNKMAEKARKSTKKRSSKTTETKAERSKIGKVLHEFKEGILHAGRTNSENIVKNRKQALAIAMSEAGIKRKKKKKK